MCLFQSTDNLMRATLWFKDHRIHKIMVNRPVPYYGLIVIHIDLVFLIIVII